MSESCRNLFLSNPALSYYSRSPVTNATCFVFTCFSISVCLLHMVQKTATHFLCTAVFAEINVKRLCCFVKYFFVQRAILMCNDSCADSITCNVDCSSGHIQDTVNTHDETDCLNRKAYGVKYHSQGYKTNTRNTCRTYRGKCCSSDNRHVIHRT